MKIQLKHILTASSLVLSTHASASWQVEQSVNKYTGENVARMTNYSSKSIWLDCHSANSLRLTIEFPGYLRREGLGTVLWTTGDEHGILDMNEHNLDSWIALKDIDDNREKSEVSLYSELTHTDTDKVKKLLVALRNAERVEFKTDGYFGAEYHQQATLNGFDEAWVEFSGICNRVHAEQS